ncbi:hypothetical protein BGZ83_009829 [Gryganskiella cystojenkinii]|nr:hypothetical protein BGZ83_009829 [Gryganskiella cystojenkinii]
MTITSESPTITQFHHYIPRFILKTFSENFNLKSSETVYIAATYFSQAGTGLKVENRRAKQRRLGHHYINLYHAQDHTSILNDVSLSYGVKNMYRDVTLKDSMKFEKLLSGLESTSAHFIRKIWTDGQELSMTRAQLADMKRFLFVMMYRSENRHGQYFDKSFDLMTYLSIKKHMDYNKIERTQDVWFKNLQYLIETPVKEIMKEFNKNLQAGSSEDPSKVFTNYSGPIHVSELMDFGFMVFNYVCIWEAEEGSEFILSEGCFGAFEGHGGFNFHNFFVVSPKYAIVLVNRHYMFDMMKTLPFRKSWFSESLHANPETVYVKGLPPKDYKESDFDQNDVFTYKRIVVPKKDVYTVNSIFLDSRRKYLTYKSSVSMLKTLRFYDKVKTEMFHDCHDYSVLKRKLFADLNRTHSI